jgi:hypothetical protein
MKKKWFKSKTKERIDDIENTIGSSDSCWHWSIVKRLDYIEHAIGSGMSIKSVLTEPKLPLPKDQIQELNDKVDAICAYLGITIKEQPTKLTCNKKE